MIGWILAVLALYVVQTLLAPAMRYLGGSEDGVERIRMALGPRDKQPPMPLLGERAHRALLNLMEALPVFLTVAILLVVTGRSEMALALTGASVFFAARLLYVPAYISGLPGIRSLCWVVGWAGLIMMIAALLAGPEPGAPALQSSR